MEEALTKEIGELSFKNYQLWYHRQFVSKALNDPSSDFEYINMALEEDNKNYHAWSQRYFILN